jgi:hypothetical protein
LNKTGKDFQECNGGAHATCIMECNSLFIVPHIPSMPECDPARQVGMP